MGRRSKCSTCKYVTYYIWAGEGYCEEVESCFLHNQIYKKTCKLYEKNNNK